MLNTCIFVGRITTEIELKKTKKENSCCNFQMAIKRTYSDVADFPPLSVYGKLAEFFAPMLKRAICSAFGRVIARL